MRWVKEAETHPFHSRQISLMTSQRRLLPLPKLLPRRLVLDDLDDLRLSIPSADNYALPIVGEGERINSAADLEHEECGGGGFFR